MDFGRKTLIEMADSFVKKFQSSVSSEIIVEFYLGTNGRPPKYRELGNKNGLGRMRVQRAIQAFREFVEKKGVSYVRLLRVFENYRIYYWEVYIQKMRANRNRKNV